MKTCDRNSIRSFLEISAELLPSEHCKRVGWDGVRRSRSPNVSLGLNAAHIHVSKNVPVHWSKAGSNPWLVVLLTLWSSGIRCKHLISGSCALPFYFIFTECFQHRMLRHARPCLGSPCTPAAAPLWLWGQFSSLLMPSSWWVLLQGRVLWSGPEQLG